MKDDTLVTFEEKIFLLQTKKEKLAKLIIIFLSVIVIMLSIAMILIFPLKTVEKELLVVDKTTGLTVSNINVNNTKNITSNEAIQRYFINRYVKAYLSYNYYDLSQSYTEIGLLSNKEVFTKFSKKLQGKNNITTIYGTDKELIVDINNINITNTITPFKTTNDGKTALIRLTVKLIDVKQQVLNETTGIATITYGFDHNLKLSSADNAINPLGFTVTSFKFDQDL